jgi:hypothetical protein
MNTVKPKQRRAANFHARDLYQAMIQAGRAGCAVRRMTIDKDGRITLDLGNPDLANADGSKGEQNEWDTLIKDQPADRAD